MNFVIAAVYKFFTVNQPEMLVAQLKELLTKQGILGTLIVAKEGMNGTICGSRSAIDAFKDFLTAQGIFPGCEYKESFADAKVFNKCKIKLKKEIVTLRIPVDAINMVGNYVQPEDWNAFIQDPKTILVDTRNDYEYEMGTFPGAVNPNTKSFPQIQAFVEQTLADKKDAQIAMMCTGGVRCEKSTALLRQQGFNNVFHLKGGILNYLTKVPADKSLWQGKCYVFDQRVGVGHEFGHQQTKVAGEDEKTCAAQNHCQ